MTSFKFRAQAALDLRRKQHEESERVLAEANRLVRLAEEELAKASQSVAQAMAGAVEAARVRFDPVSQQWHRNWITRLQQHVARCRWVLDQQRRAAQSAKERAMHTRRRLRSLERLRDRAWQQYQRAANRAEQKQLDLLGTLRYTARRHSQGGLVS